MKKIGLSSIFSLIFLAILSTLVIPVMAQKSKPIIVLSPGHGWLNDAGTKIDSGAVYLDIAENVINLNIAQATRAHLQRCPVDVFLTREGDDSEHKLGDVDEIVNALNPSVGVSIHFNAGTATDSGSQGWYTVGGYDDMKSEELAGILSSEVSQHVSIPDLGVFAETENRYGGLYIHWWNAPSALVEVAYKQADYDKLKNNQDDFGAGIAISLLKFLDIDIHCNDWGELDEFLISTYYQGEQKTMTAYFENQGTLPWAPGDYVLRNVKNLFGSPEQYALTETVKRADYAMFPITAIAPEKSGIYRQEWQLERNGVIVGKKFVNYIIVVPQYFQTVKDEIDQQISEFIESGKKEIEDFINQLEQELLKKVREDLPSLICPNILVVPGIGLLFTIMLRKIINQRP